MIEMLQLKTLAELLEEQGDYSSAEPLYRKALAVKESLFGAEHENLVEDLYNLGLLCYALNRLSESENLLMRAWQIERRYKGSMHADTIHTFEMLSELHRARASEEQKFCIGFGMEIERGAPVYH